MATQKNRFALNAAMQAGASEHWDYNPPSEASQQYRAQPHGLDRGG